MASGVISLGLAVSLIADVTHGPLRFGFLRADSLSVVFVLTAAFLYASAAVYAIGYVNRSAPAGYQRRFLFGLNIFGWAMICAPLVDGLALLWVAIEVTTVVSALMVAVDRTRAAAEAAWKYLLIASAGLGIGLFATIIIYHAGTTVYGLSYDLTLNQMIAAGGRLDSHAARLAFVLAVLGYGTKVGLAPVHTWLPDAHTEAPTPISAMLSGSLLAVSFYAVLRYVQITQLSVGAGFVHTVLIVFGLLSLFIAAFSLLVQRDLKRLLAYSSIEHMGLLCLGVGFGAPIALTGVLLHILAHAAAKGNAFFCAGVIMHKYGTKDIGSIRGGLDKLPWTGPLLVASVLALSAFPPFGLFRSEFMIIAGGLARSSVMVVAALLVLITIAFVGLIRATTSTMFVPARPGTPAAALPRSEPSAWMVVPIVVGSLALVVLGIHPPDQVMALLGQAVTEFGER
ncbi:proton-conducting transporter transmembrane domain-containing protein [Microlunatus endophyticus]|uniref:proton-conducting transporter transmembrane domain-containing protein n=1 Tax=Microlunatus endophyticus TaxID=1716077 RepID=UPI001E57DEBF|nr:proton-conducting transporter membrane subunit [Microlunatus endophyticus]